MKKETKIAIIGGGVAGSTSALMLGQQGLNVTLFEREPSIVNGPPFCHLHAGGNLYREISDQQCLSLLKQSIDFLRFYPFVVDYRPTVILLPTTDSGTPAALLPRLERLTQAYAQLVANNPDNEVLGCPQEYYQLYDRTQLETLRQRPTIPVPSSSDEWMIPVAKSIDLDKVQFPLILVQEYGLNLFRLGGGVTAALEAMPEVTLRTQTVVAHIQALDNQWRISYTNGTGTHHEDFDYLINASGFRTGKIDDMLGVPCKRMVEFKAAYVTQWGEYHDTLFPEMIFHGERGTPQGMGQFTPYPGGYFQLHGMTHDITLYDDGLVANSTLSCQPKLGQQFIDKIEKSWTQEEVTQRTTRAIEHLAQYIPKFTQAEVGGKPLFGAQQIPGDDPTLRVAEVSFPMQGYARCEIVKVSSAMDMVDAIVRKFVELGYLDKEVQGKREYTYLDNLEEPRIQAYAQRLCQERDYPIDLADRNVPR